MRLTNTIRDNIRAQIMGNVPSIDYEILLAPIVQDVIVKHMDPHVRAVYENPKTRSLLVSSTCKIRTSARGEALYTRNPSEDGKTSWYRPSFDHHGLKDSLDINLEPRAVEHTKPGTLYYDVMQAIIKTGYAEKYFEQKQLLEDVQRRVKDTLASVSTTQKLFDVLEPEFHHLIPRDDDKKIQLPATAAPFADDLRKLGANLPDVPKAKKSKRA